MKLNGALFSAALLCAFCAGSAPAQSVKARKAEKAAPAPEGKHAVLVIAQEGDARYENRVRKAVESLGRDNPARVVFGGGDARAMQAAVNELNQYSPERFVAIPIFLSSQNDALEQTRYLLGVSEAPAPDFLAGTHGNSTYSSSTLGRIKFLTEKMPLVITPALDADSRVGDAIAAQASALPLDLKDYSLVVVGVGSLSNKVAAREFASLARSAEYARKKTGMRAASAFLMRPFGSESAVRFMEETQSAEKDAAKGKSDGALKATHGMAAKLDVKKFSKPSKPLADGADMKQSASVAIKNAVRAYTKEGGKVLVVGFSLVSGDLDRDIQNMLDGCFYTFGGTAYLNGDRISAYLNDRLASGLRLPNMREFTRAASSLY